MSDVSLALRPLMTKEWPVAHQKWKNEQIAHFFQQIAHLQYITQITDEKIPNPATGSSFFISTIQCLYNIWYL